jgi:hypothetical protein
LADGDAMLSIGVKFIQVELQVLHVLRSRGSHEEGAGI